MSRTSVVWVLIGVALIALTVGLMERFWSDAERVSLNSPNRGCGANRGNCCTDEMGDAVLSRKTVDAAQAAARW